jgi:hypothetical protein
MACVPAVERSLRSRFRLRQNDVKKPKFDGARHASPSLKREIIIIIIINPHKRTRTQLRRISDVAASEPTVALLDAVSTPAHR